MEEQVIDFWKRVNLLIKSNGTKQQVVAESCNIPYQTLRGWVTRHCYPDALQTYKIAKALNTSVEYLITGQESSPSAAELSNLKQKIRELAASLN